VAWSARRIPYGRLSRFSRPDPLLFFQVAPHLSLQGLRGPRFRPTPTQKVWERRESNPGPLGQQPGTVTTTHTRKLKLSKQAVEAHRRVSCQARTSFTHEKVKLFPYQAVEAHRYFL
jgi:hypothetical protein